MATANSFPSEISEIITICAIRFDGYKYESAKLQAAADQTGLGLKLLMDQVVGDLRFHEDNDHNFAAFFGLQRFLHKFGGEYLTKESDEHIAYDYLFLHLYRVETPRQFGHPEYSRKWDEIASSRREEVASYVRRSFRR